jgi:urease accessory protein
VRSSTSRAFLALAILAVSPAVFAHHPLGGMAMSTFGHGLLSGIGHPVLGFDHLFFVVAVGLAAAFTGRAYVAPAGYIGAMLVGCVLTASGITVPGIEVAIVASLVILGYLVLSGRALAFGPAVALFALAGLDLLYFAVAFSTVRLRVIALPLGVVVLWLAAWESRPATWLPE